MLALHEAGRRTTIPRIKVASALQHAGGHLTAEEIHELIVEHDAQAAIALSTVYRTLETLKEIRLVAETAGTPRSTYEWVDQAHPHSHLACRRCGRETALDPRVLEAFAEEIRASSGFEAYLDHFVVGGLCADCRALAASTANAPLTADAPSTAIVGSEHQ
jgi:Fe2+ or Zn2+ uptake regulation protein